MIMNIFFLEPHGFGISIQEVPKPRNPIPRKFFMVIFEFIGQNVQKFWFCVHQLFSKNLYFNSEFFRTLKKGIRNKKYSKYVKRNCHSEFGLCQNFIEMHICSSKTPILRCSTLMPTKLLVIKVIKVSINLFSLANFFV
jgi:hypothetical protein